MLDSFLKNCLNYGTNAWNGVYEVAVLAVNPPYIPLDKMLVSYVRNLSRLFFYPFFYFFYVI